jgi:hypothetical protein
VQAVKAELAGIECIEEAVANITSELATPPAADNDDDGDDIMNDASA